MTRIDHYEFGRIVIDGREETRDLIILPDPGGAELVAAGGARAGG